MSKTTTISDLCAVCRRKVPEGESDLIGGPWDTSICANCCRQRMLDDGGLMIRFASPPRGAAFDIEEVHIKPGALHYLIESREHCWSFIERHANTGAPYNPGDQNKTVRIPFLEGSGNRVSEHKTATGKRIWLMTNANGLTVMMAPGEF